MSLWTKVDENADSALYEATLPLGGPIHVVSRKDQVPPDYLVEHHAKAFGNDPPKAELGATGYRFLNPGATEWREYDFTPKVP